MSDWIEWSGGKCPVDEDVRVDVRYRSKPDLAKGIRHPSTGLTAGDYAWWHDGEDDDIVAYRVVE